MPTILPILALTCNNLGIPIRVETTLSILGSSAVNGLNREQIAKELNIMAKMN
jgi:hypothetical protein